MWLLPACQSGCALSRLLHWLVLSHCLGSSPRNSTFVAVADARRNKTFLPVMSQAQRTSALSAIRRARSQEKRAILYYTILHAIIIDYNSILHYSILYYMILYYITLYYHYIISGRGRGSQVATPNLIHEAAPAMFHATCDYAIWVSSRAN